MTEEEARDWLASRYPVAAIARLERYIDMLTRASTEQSLIARSTLPHIWARHIVDSAQLVTLAPGDGVWLDIGSGAGLPGIVVAILRDAPVVLSEPRRKRVEFLDAVIAGLRLQNVEAQVVKAQLLTLAHAQVVSARAVAPMSDILAWSAPFVSRETRYLLQRGQSWQSELEITRRAWHGRFHVEHSLTDPTSGIVIAQGVARR